jgi:hypothetical protein
MKKNNQEDFRASGVRDAPRLRDYAAPGSCDNPSSCDERNVFFAAFSSEKEDSASRRGLRSMGSCPMPCKPNMDHAFGDHIAARWCF